MKKNLIFSELEYFRWKPVIIQMLFFTVLLLFIIFFVVKSVLNGMFAELAAISNFMGIFDTIFLSRLSFGVNFFIAWLLVPKIFYGKKLCGEIESVISAGYSAADVWIAKSVAVILLDMVLSLPLVALIYLLLKIMMLAYGFSLAFDFGWIMIMLGFLLVFNPMILFVIILLAGGIQMVTNDFLKSTMIIYMLFFLNFFTFNIGTQAIIENGTGIYWFISAYAAVLAGLGVYILHYKRKITNENVIVTLCDLDKITAKNFEKLDRITRRLRHT